MWVLKGSLKVFVDSFFFCWFGFLFRSRGTHSSWFVFPSLPSWRTHLLKSEKLQVVSQEVRMPSRRILQTLPLSYVCCVALTLLLLLLGSLSFCFGFFHFVSSWFTLWFVFLFCVFFGVFLCLCFFAFFCVSSVPFRARKKVTNSLFGGPLDEESQPHHDLDSKAL